MKKYYVLLGLITLMFQFAQAQFTLSGEFKPRTEFRNGFGNLIADPALPGFSTSTRARLNAGFKTEGYEVFISLQDVMVWGENRQILPHDANDSFNVFQAYAEIPLAPGLSTKLGRQILSYDDDRILGSLDWAQQGRNHDAALLKYKKDDLAIDFAFAYNQDFAHTTATGNPLGFQSTSTDFNTSGFFTYKVMQMLHANKKFGDFSGSLLIMNNTFENASIGLNESVDLQTIGAHLKYGKGAFSASGNIFLQTGKAIYGPAYQDVESGYLAALDLGYKVTPKVQLGAGFEIISGDGDDDATKTNAFFPLYGTNHKFNGLMDYFYVGNHANSAGLVDIHVSAKFTLSPKSSLILKVLNFSAHEDFKNKATGADGDKALGTEIDIVFKKTCKGFVWVSGYSQMFASDGMYDLKSTPTLAFTKDNRSGIQNWAWTMLVIKPKFLGNPPAAPKAPVVASVN